MEIINNFTHQFPISKTIRFRLIPVAETEDNFKINKILEADEKRAVDYTVVKEIIDNYHRDYIEDAFLSFEKNKRKENADDKKIKEKLDLNEFTRKIKEYANLYYKSGKSLKDKKDLRDNEKELRKTIALVLKTDAKFAALFSKEMINKILPEYLKDKGSEHKIDTLKEFSGFTTYFKNFHENRKNMYSDENQVTAISHRCINDNLPKFLDNAKVFSNSDFQEKLKEDLLKLNEDFCGIYGSDIEGIFDIAYFPFILSQSGIDKYNSIIGGYTNSDGSKVKGLNEYINLYNQKSEKKDKIPKLKQLYKQILSKIETISFIPEKFESDNEVLKAIKSYYAGDSEKSILDVIITFQKMFSDINDYNLDGIFVKNNPDLTAVCSGVYDYWGTVENAWFNEYDSSHGFKDTEKYIETRKKAYKAVDSFSISEIQRYAESLERDEKCRQISDWIKNEVTEKCECALNEYNDVKNLIENDYNESKKLYKNDKAIELIKNALDSIKDLERFVNLFSGTGKEENKDETFYGDFAENNLRLSDIDRLYDKVRNYMTQKPYKTDKIKINFDNASLLSGWDRNKENEFAGTLLFKDNDYYLAILNKKDRNVLSGTDYYTDNSKNTYKKMVYKQIPDASKYLSIKQILPQNPPEIIKKILEKKKKKEVPLSEKEIATFIDYCKNDFLANYPKIIDEKGNNYFNFDFKETKEYKSLDEFFADVDKQAYSLNFVNIDGTYIDKLVSEGKMFLFQIYCKDFSKKSSGKGTPNLHTMYFKALFDDYNLANRVISLNGGAEIFYRKSSLSLAETTTHHKNEPIENKSEAKKGTSTTFDYDIVKDRRYTTDQMFVHIPITLNFTEPKNSDINFNVRKALKECKDNYIIGIDRGERNLLYICVIDSKGNIIYQDSLNDINNGQEHNVNYHNILEQRENERKKSRESWKSIESIKELKEGYVSQVVHKICQLVEQYDAIIAMEDLNSGFKRVRGGKFEKSVYQKFEKMLIDKLNYMADKKKQPEEIGSILNAYQLTNKFESFQKMGKQNGFIFYLPAYLTSKIDPTTGFADLLHPRYSSVNSSKEFIEKFDNISYNSAEDYFEFAFNYDNFPKCNIDFKKEWTVCTFGERIDTFRNSEKNNEWDNKTVKLTVEFKKLFEEYGIDYNHNLKDQILNQSEKRFFKKFLHLLSLTLQMRNSITGNTDVDYLISPVKNKTGRFYNSNDFKGIENAPLPKDADANGAYNIARKGLWAIEQVKACETDDELADDSKLLFISNSQWLEFAQSI